MWVAIIEREICLAMKCRNDTSLPCPMPTTSTFCFSQLLTDRTPDQKPLLSPLTFTNLGRLTWSPWICPSAEVFVVLQDLISANNVQCLIPSQSKLRLGTVAGARCVGSGNDILSMDFKRSDLEVMYVQDNQWAPEEACGSWSQEGKSWVFFAKVAQPRLYTQSLHPSVRRAKERCKKDWWDQNQKS